jgi:hypothetical protein
VGRVPQVATAPLPSPLEGEGGRAKRGRMRGAGRSASASFLPTPLIRLGADAPIHLLPQGEKGGTAPSCDWLISPLVGEMAGRPEGGAVRYCRSFVSTCEHSLDCELFGRTVRTRHRVTLLGNRNSRRSTPACLLKLDVITSPRRGLNDKVSQTSQF